mmetsp:Transcript_1280/g.1434  ORF Transcript_1280/g.1434 Transcript_1280/m.1434 type:complete len:153 (-) Transcript_1280:40-498(-)
MSDDKKQPWRKGLDQVKVFYKDTNFTTFLGSFHTNAAKGKETFIKNSKTTIKEVRTIMPRMMVNHQAAWIGMKTYFKHKVYIYTTLKARLFLMGGLGLWVGMKTANLKYTIIYRLLAFWFMQNLIVPDFDMHKKRLAMESAHQAEWLKKFFN